MPISRFPLQTRAAATLLAMLFPSMGACDPATRNQSGGGRERAVSIGAEAVRYLDSRNPSISVPVPATPPADQDAFVAIEVREVINPRRVPLTFEVGFQPAQGDPVRLGEFSLFPPDNPGRFIVAAQGRVGPGGSIVVSIAESDRAAADGVRVAIAGVGLTNR